MKIFNWVHRRLILKDGLGQDHVKKDEEILINNDHADTAALLEKVFPGDMLQFRCWGGARAGAGAGILSIGTFGLNDTFSTNHEHNKEYLGLMAGDDQDTESEDDEYSDQSHDVEDNDDNSSDGEEEHYEEEWNLLVYDKSGAPRPRPSNAIIIINNIDDTLVRPSNGLVDYSEEMKKKKKERITLADLFSADSDDGIGTTKKPNNYCKTQCINKNKPTPQTPDRAPKNGTLFPKKLIPRVKEDSRPIQKLQGLMKRMLKRKVHPDVVEGKIKPCASGNGIPSADEFGIIESVSLLRSQDVDIPITEEQMTLESISSMTVYDVSSFLDDHPGGDEVLLTATGKDATTDFEDVGHSDDARELLTNYYIGDVDISTLPAKHQDAPTAAASSAGSQTCGGLVKILQFLIPLIILGLAFALRQYKKKE